MDEPIRKRIVINLDQPVKKRGGEKRTAVPTQRSIWPRVLLIATAVVVFISMLGAFGAFLWWRNFQSTPAYAIALMIDAAQRDDMDALSRQIDDDAIARSMVMNVGDKAATQYGLVVSGVLHKHVEKLLPSLLPELKQTMHREIAKEVKEFAARAEHKPFVVIAVSVPYLATITTEDKNATAAATVNNRKVELTMHLDNDQWKVVDFKDDVLTQRVVDSIVKNLPTIGGFDIGNIIRPSRRQSGNAADTH